MTKLKYKLDLTDEQRKYYRELAMHHTFQYREEMIEGIIIPKYDGVWRSECSRQFITETIVEMFDDVGFPEKLARAMTGNAGEVAWYADGIKQTIYLGPDKSSAIGCMAVTGSTFYGLGLERLGFDHWDTWYPPLSVEAGIEVIKANLKTTNGDWFKAMVIYAGAGSEKYAKLFK